MYNSPRLRSRESLQERVTPTMILAELKVIALSSFISYENQ